MPKFYGQIGFTETVETKPGVWRDQITERNYYGDLIRNTRRLEAAGQVNDNINISNQLSILADAYARDHMYSMRYVVFQGAKWKVASVEVQYPRLILQFGGLYNVETES